MQAPMPPDVGDRGQLEWGGRGGRIDVRVVSERRHGRTAIVASPAATGVAAVAAGAYGLY